VTRKHFAALALVPTALLLLVAMVLPARAADPPGPGRDPSSWGAKLTCTANSSGYCTVAHPAGVVPDAVTVTPAGPAITSVDQLTTAAFRIRFVRTIASNGSATALPGTHTFYVHVDWTPSRTVACTERQRAGQPEPRCEPDSRIPSPSLPSASPSPEHLTVGQRLTVTLAEYEPGRLARPGQHWRPRPA
jgi:hypothetical protein